jgi:hypothetical protein
MYLARELTGASLPRLGRAFDRHHTTVVHAIVVVERLMWFDPAFAEAVAALRTTLAEPGSTYVGPPDEAGRTRTELGRTKGQPC